MTQRSLIIIFVLCLVELSACTEQPLSLPKLLTHKSVAPDLKALAVETWSQFLATFPAHTNCIGDVTLRASKTITDRAMYDPVTATVTVKVPATPALLQGALIHEWAHHVEYQCPAQEAMRAAFLIAQGFPADTGWRTGPSWAMTPAEQYAEAAILLVLSERAIPTNITVSTEAVHVLAEWATRRVSTTHGR